MRIAYLLERVDELWGGVKVVLEDANWLAARGHDVTVVARSAPPQWMQLHCNFVRTEDFERASLPISDVMIGTIFTTVPHAILSQSVATVHFCQGYEGDFREYQPLREQIETIYSLQGVHHITIASHLTELLHERFGIEAQQVPQAIDHRVHYPDEANLERDPGRPLRIGLVGHYKTPGKGIKIGIEACRLAHAAGLELELVRVTSKPDPREDAADTPFATTIHTAVHPKAMGKLYRSLDVLIGPATSPAEGFYLPAVEAMANGVPCVLSDLACFHGYDEGSDYAHFVEVGNPRAIARALFEISLQNEHRLQLRTAGLATAARFTQETHGEALEHALVQVWQQASKTHHFQLM